VGRVIITGGATRNGIDAARYIGAYSSGESGAYMAALLASRHMVYFLGSPQACDRVNALLHEAFTDTRDLEWRMRSACPGAAAIIHAAAVGDYELAEPFPSKIPSRQEELVLRLRPAPNILDQIRGWEPNALLVSFKAAAPDVEDIVAVARAQLERTGSDIVFANRLGDLDKSCVIVTKNDATPIPGRREALQALARLVLADLDVRIPKPDLLVPY
jgi:phosphopantothenoylcysteine decarboxylase/phosphopantothenate--cysteine ligase